jgi:undecaprenyl-phosphate 4-deoxy-4-formamido-L-arabinose transferase
MSRQPARISVLIPVYNGSGSLPALIQRLQATLTAAGLTYEVILVDDGSRDSSWAVVQEQARLHYFVRGVRLRRNYGQHNALLCGIRKAAHEVIVTMDDDLQHPPEEIPKLLGKLNEGFDVVYGVPASDSHELWRALASRITKLALQSAMNARIASDVSAFRVFRTGVRDAFALYQAPFVSIDVLLSWGTTRFAAVHVRHEPRLTGRSNYTFRKLVVHALNMMTGFSTLPLQLASVLGFALTIFGVLVLVFVLGRLVISGQSVPGFPFLASMIAIFSGAQMFALGIIGEYLARMHFRSMDRPVYTVAETTEETVSHARE